MEQVKSHISERLHLIPAYRRKLAMVPFNMGHPTWVDDDTFDLDFHIQGHDLGTDVALQDAIDHAVTLNEPMLDRRRPLWMIHVIKGVADRTLILQMTHHCLIDGASGSSSRPSSTIWTPTRRPRHRQAKRGHQTRNPHPHSCLQTLCKRI